MATVRRRPDGRYEIRGMVEGRRYSVYGHTEDEARSKWRQLEAQLALGRPLPVNCTVRELCERWLASGQSQWKPRTYENYRKLLEQWIYPAIGSLRLSRLAPDRLERLFRTIPGKRVAHQAYRALHRCFEIGVRWGYLAENVLDRITPPTYQAPRVELPDREALTRLFQTCLISDDPFAPLVAFLLISGLRLGEALALEWDDVDLDEGVVHVRRSGQWIGGQWVTTQPKTRAGQRSVALGPIGRQLLRRQRAVVARRRLAAGEKWAGGRLVFPNTTGGPLQGSTVCQALARLCDQAGVPRLSPHQCRHGAASLMLAARAPISEVARRLGHASPMITLSIYAHAVEDQREIAHAVERLLSR